MKLYFDIGTHVRIVEQPENVYEENIFGLTGKIVDIDPEWLFPYEVAFDDGVERQTCLFNSDQLEKVDKEEPVKTKHLPSTSKLMYIQDVDGSVYGKNASIIDLEKGVNRLNLHTMDIEDVIMHIQHNKPSQLIFDIHDGEFRKVFNYYVETHPVGFKLEKNGEVIYE